MHPARARDHAGPGQVRGIRACRWLQGARQSAAKAAAWAMSGTRHMPLAVSA
jgi:hypothetical protein